MVTASHNPPDYNGMKFVREGSRPISADTGLKDMQAHDRAGHAAAEGGAAGRGTHARHRRVLHRAPAGYVDVTRLKPLKVVVNAGNGGAGLIVDQLEPHLPFEFVKIHHEPDGSFPNGVPNPMLEENRASHHPGGSPQRRRPRPGLGRRFRPLLLLRRGRRLHRGLLPGRICWPRRSCVATTARRIVHDPRLTWNTIDIVQQCGGTPVLCKSGHAFIKQKMREVDAVYGGEMSAHHYFRDFAYCDSGMIPWLLVLAIMSEIGQVAFGAGGRAPAALSRQRRDQSRAQRGHGRHVTRCWRGCSSTIRRVPGSIDFTDGLSMEFDRWRFNLRGSNTEPLVRLNVESRGDAALMQDKTAEVLRLLDGR